MASLVSFSSSSSFLLTTSTSSSSVRVVPTASLTFLTGSRTKSSLNLNSISKPNTSLLHSSFLHSSTTSSLSFPSSFSGSPLQLGFDSHTGPGTEKRRGLVVRAGKAALCQTKRNRSRKSLARTHGFRRRMRTTSGRAVLKRRRAKGRWVLCPKSNPSSGKRA